MVHGFSLVQFKYKTQVISTQDKWSSSDIHLIHFFDSPQLISLEGVGAIVQRVLISSRTNDTDPFSIDTVGASVGASVGAVVPQWCSKTNRDTVPLCKVYLW